MTKFNIFQDLIPFQSNELYFREFVTSDINENYLRELNNKKYLSFSQLANGLQDKITTVKYMKTLDPVFDIFIKVESKNVLNGDLGFITLRYLKSYEKIDISLRVVSEVANNGYGTLIIKELINKLKFSLSPLDLTAGTHKDNIGMQKVLLKNGFLVNNDTDENNNYIFFIRKI